MVSVGCRLVAHLGPRKDRCSGPVGSSLSRVSRAWLTPVTPVRAATVPRMRPPGWRARGRPGQSCAVHTLRGHRASALSTPAPPVTHGHCGGRCHVQILTLDSDCSPARCQNPVILSSCRVCSRGYRVAVLTPMPRGDRLHTPHISDRSTENHVSYPRSPSVSLNRHELIFPFRTTESISPLEMLGNTRGLEICKLQTVLNSCPLRVWRHPGPPLPPLWKDRSCAHRPRSLCPAPCGQCPPGLCGTRCVQGTFQPCGEGERVSAWMLGQDTGHHTPPKGHAGRWVQRRMSRCVDPTSCAFCARDAVPCVHFTSVSTTSML